MRKLTMISRTYLENKIHYFYSHTIYENIDDAYKYINDMGQISYMYRDRKLFFKNSYDESPTLSYNELMSEKEEMIKQMTFVYNENNIKNHKVGDFYLSTLRTIVPDTYGTHGIIKDFGLRFIEKGDSCYFDFS